MGNILRPPNVCTRTTAMRGIYSGSGSLIAVANGDSCWIFRKKRRPGKSEIDIVISEWFKRLELTHNPFLRFDEKLPLFSDDLPGARNLAPFDVCLWEEVGPPATPVPKRALDLNSPGANR